MTIYDPPSDTDLGIEKPILSSVNIRLRDMAIAITEGTSPAPAIQTAALEQTGGSEAVTQACIRDAAVGQGQLKTTTGEVSQVLSAGASSTKTNPGGQYSLGGIESRGGTAQTHQVSLGPATVTTVANTSYASYIQLLAGPITLTVYGRVRYVQSSPPYDHGDGEIPLFIFAEINKATGDVVGVWEAPEAPWHNNGPTNTRADTYVNGIGYQYRKDTQAIDDTMFAAGHPKGLTKASAKALSILAYQDYFSAFNESPDILVEVTQEIKQADMNMSMLSRPMEPTDNTVVVMLDPVADLGMKLLDMKKHDEFSINELLHDGDLIITNEVTRAGPQGVPVHGYKWR